MARSLFSSSWHSVADLKPRLLPQARIERHVYRGQVWFVVQDPSGGRYHRLSPAAHALVRQMTGDKTVQAIWETANNAGLGDACTQNEVVDLLTQLHAADLLQTDAYPDSAVLFDRHQKKRKATLKQYLLNPMSLKFPLYDPDALLRFLLPYLGWWFSPLGAALWLVSVLPAVILAAQHEMELTRNWSDQLLSSSNLTVMALVYPIVKLLHELGHGLATRVWGGAVHEMGLMFLVFAPVPYVNASASAAFPSKIRRAIVAAAGMLVELWLAAIALYFWLLAEPGLARAIAYNVMVVAGISTLAVNGNPLLRYDGYYILCDLIEMPNLAQRGQKYLSYWWDSVVFGAKELDAPPETPSERRWLLLYTPLAWCYRTLVTISITWFVADQFFIFGVLIALWGAFTLIAIPLWKGYQHVTRSPSLHRQRRRALRIASSLSVGILLIAFGLPVPLYTRVDGVVWLPEQALLRAGGNGFFEKWLIQPGSRVQSGDALFELKDQALVAQLAVAEAKVAEAQAKYRAEQFVDQAKAALSQRQLQQELSLLNQLQQRVARLVCYAQTDGYLVATRPQDLAARYFKQGELIGYVLEKNHLIARVIIQQDDIDLVRSRLRSAELRFADKIAEHHEVYLVSAPAGGMNELPTPALGLTGGGTIATAPNDEQGIKTLNRIFAADLSLPDDLPPAAFGERVYVRFHHGFEPMAWQGLRRLRQLFLSRFSV